MAHVVPFDGCNRNFGPPPGLEEMVGHLPCFMNGAVVVSAWKFTPEELQAIIDADGVAFISVMSGASVFATFVGSEEMTKQVASDTGRVW